MCQEGRDGAARPAGASGSGGNRSETHAGSHAGRHHAASGKTGPTVSLRFACAHSFVLPQGLRQGPQQHMDVQVNTIDFDPGPYKLLISQQDCKAHPVALSILPAPPRIDNFPIVVNQGVSQLSFVLKGQRLDLLKRLEVAGHYSFSGLGSNALGAGPSQEQQDQDAHQPRFPARRSDRLSSAVGSVDARPSGLVNYTWSHHCDVAPATSREDCGNRLREQPWFAVPV